MGEDVVRAVGAEEEGNTNSIDEEAEGFVHVVDERNGDSEVIGNRGQVRDGIEVLGSVEAAVEFPLEQL